MSNNVKLGIWFLVVLLLLGGLIHLWAGILPPFFVAALFSYLCNPLINLLIRRGLTRTLAVVVVFFSLLLILTLLMFILIPLMSSQLQLAWELFSNFLIYAQAKLAPWLQQQFGMNNLDLNQLRNLLTDQWRTAGSMMTNILHTLGHSSAVMLQGIINVILIFVVTFYLMRDWHVVLENATSLLPQRVRPTVEKLFDESNRVLGAFFRGQLLVMLCLGIFYSLGLTIVGLKLGFLIGMVSGLLSIVPYLGLIIGSLAAFFAGLWQFPDWHSALYVFVVFGCGQALEGMVLTPFLVGDSIGLHPVAVIFSVLAGGELFGFVGILLALPTAAVIMVLLRFGFSHYVQSELYRHRLEEP